MRHGATSFMISRDVVSGQGVAPYLWADSHRRRFPGPRIARTMAAAPTATRRQFVVDTLTIHTSTLLVRYVADLCG